MRSPTSNEAQLQAAAKLITDLSLLVNALHGSVRGARTWQRQLQLQLQDVAGHLEILRLTIAMERHDSEITSASSDLLGALRRAELAGRASRADATTRAGLNFALGLAARLNENLHEVPIDSSDGSH